ncbi:MAC/perforin domain-containing protein [Streptomyces mirabilis]|uniref:MAC/perforin domain-containing protein n=1 Tax=Streptomyces mirabilis TaxID=68239 RepID=UPI00367E2A2C
MPRSVPPSAAGLPFLSQANALGQGFNVYGTFSADSLITPLFDLRASGSQVFTFLGRDYQIPGIASGIEDTTTYYLATVSDTRDSFQNSIAVHANVDASYGAFSGELEAAYSNEYATSREYTFAYRNVYAQLARLQLSPAVQYLTKEFTDRLATLPFSLTSENLEPFEDFFNTFGTYFTSEVTLGASLGFWVATEKTSEVSDTEISAALSAQYEGLTQSGSISADITNTAGWKAYSTSTSVSLQAVGSDPTKGAKVAALDPWNPSPGSVATYSAWIDSIATDPALVDFRLTGIWELCGPRRKVVQQAWDAYGTTMRPNLVVNAITSLSPPVSPVTPAITLGRLIAPAAPPKDNAGYQAVVLDGTDITGSASVLFDRYYAMNASTWPNAYAALYDEMYADLSAGNLTTGGNVLILAGFNVNWNAVPTPGFVNVLRAAGCGDRLDYWLTHNDNGSSLGTPATVIVVGIFGQGAGTAVETIQAEPWSPPTAAQLEVLFYRRTDGNGYAIGPGDID